MKTQQVTIMGDLAKLNDHDSANRTNKFGGAALKKRMTDLVALQCLRMKPITGECVVTFHWFVSGKHDYDNVRFSCKYVLDGMVKSGKLPNDNPKYIVGFGGDDFTKVAKGQEKVIVEIEETDR